MTMLMHLLGLYDDTDMVETDLIKAGSRVKQGRPQRGAEEASLGRCSS